MYKQIILSLVFFSPFLMSQDNEIYSPSKLEMMEDIQVWVADQTGQNQDNIEVLAIDRRLKVPSCSTEFDVSFPYQKSQRTVLARCKNPEWFAYIGIRFQNASLALTYTRDFDAGEAVSPKDLISIKVSGGSKNRLENSDHLNGKLLIRRVSKGEVAFSHDFGDGIEAVILKRDILKGDPITSADMSYKTVIKKQASKGSSFPKTLLSNATASRDLLAGSVLSRQDLHIRQDVLMSLKPIFRGQLINTSNTEVTPFYGNLPEDALTTNQEGRWMEAIRTIRGGQPIRASDLKPALMVKEGDTVLLSVVSGVLTITSSMVALEDGKLDQQIDLINLESNEKVRAMVTGKGRAESL
jgi:flagella basal body P-ring formation protein FlgA